MKNNPATFQTTRVAPIIRASNDFTLKSCNDVDKIVIVGRKPTV